jgi:hypothetical protein
MLLKTLKQWDVYNTKTNMKTKQKIRSCSQMSKTRTTYTQGGTRYKNACIYPCNTVRKDNTPYQLATLLYIVKSMRNQIQKHLHKPPMLSAK